MWLFSEDGLTPHSSDYVNKYEFVVHSRDNETHNIRNWYFKKENKTETANRCFKLINNNQYQSLATVFVLAESETRCEPMQVGYLFLRDHWNRIATCCSI